MASLLPRFAAAATIGIGLCALAGWLLDLSVLKSILPQEAPLEANAGAGLLLAGLALWRLSRIPLARDRPAQAMAAAVLVLGLATLAQYVFELELNIDELLFQDTSELPGGTPGRMSPYSAVAFVGAGFSLLAFNVASLRPLVWTGATLTAALGAVPVAGYLANASVVVENRWLSPAAATFAFVLLGVGTLVASLRQRGAPEARSPRSSIEKKIIAAFAGALVLLFIGAAFTYRASIDFTRSVEGVWRVEQLREALANLRVALTGAESAQTAYLLTSRQYQRDEHERLIASARVYQQVIANAVASDPSQAQDLRELDGHIDRRVDLLLRVTALFDDNGLSSAREAVASEDGVQEMRAIEALTARMDERGETLLLQRESTLARTRELTLGSLLLTLAVAAGIFLTLFRGISREMAARAASEGALRQVNTEMHALNAALAQRAAEVEAANKELEAFSYSVSHDLRVPLRHIDGYIEMLRDENAAELSPEAQHKLEVIADSSHRMSVLIDDLLAFSRVGRMELHIDRVDLDQLVREAIASLEMETRGRAIDWDIRPLPPVAGDVAMLRQVFSNLIENAIKYSARRDTARIEVGTSGEEDGKCVFYVRDNGVGFDMQHAGRLFGIFQRLHRAEDFEGTGIGLANVQRIIARHGGRVWAQAEPDRGATFFFTLERFS